MKLWKQSIMAHMQVLHGNVLSLAVRKFPLHAILGFLQVQFLSSAIGISIQQHVEFHYDDMYRLRLTPVCGVKHTTIHIMWVKFSPSSTTLDHICPLIPMDSASCNEILCKKLINIFVCLYHIQCFQPICKAMKSLLHLLMKRAL